MKKIIVIGSLLALFGATAVYAEPLIKAVKAYEFMAQIETTNSGNVFIYKVVDKDTSCYVMTSDSYKYGPQLGISCVNTPVK